MSTHTHTRHTHTHTHTQWHTRIHVMMYTHIHTQRTISLSLTHTHTHTHTQKSHLSMSLSQTDVHPCVHEWMHVCASECVHACVHCMHVCVHACMCMRLQMSTVYITYISSKLLTNLTHWQAGRTVPQLPVALFTCVKQAGKKNFQKNDWCMHLRLRSLRRFCLILVITITWHPPTTASSASSALASTSQSPLSQTAGTDFWPTVPHISATVSCSYSLKNGQTRVHFLPPHARMNDNLRQRCEEKLVGGLCFEVCSLLFHFFHSCTLWGLSFGLLQSYRW